MVKGSWKASDPYVPKNYDNSDTEMKIMQGLNWYQFAQNRGSVRLPKLDRKNRILIYDGINKLIENELIPLIEEYNPDTWPELDKDIKRKVFEGVYEEIIHRIRVHIATKLNLDTNRIYNKSHKRPRPCHQLNCIQKGSVHSSPALKN